MEMLYGDAHPYGRRAARHRRDRRANRRRGPARLPRAAHVTPSSVSLAVVGDVEPDAGGRRGIFGVRSVGAQRPVRRSSVQRVPEPAGASYARDSDDEQVAGRHRLRLHGDHPGRPAFYAYWLMNHILGQYSMGGRLGDSIRERQGMAYYVFSSLDANVVPGPLMIRAGVSPANVARAVASIDAELTSLVDRRSDRAGAARVEADTSSARCRARSRPTPASPRSCRPRSSSVSGWTTMSACPISCGRSRATRCTRRRDAPSIRRRPTVVVAGPYDGPLT